MLKRTNEREMHTLRLAVSLNPWMLAGRAWPYVVYVLRPNAAPMSSQSSRNETLRREREREGRGRAVTRSSISLGGLYIYYQGLVNRMEPSQMRRQHRLSRRDGRTFGFHMLSYPTSPLLLIEPEKHYCDLVISLYSVLLDWGGLERSKGV
jgi:hypothetical protein